MCDTANCIEVAAIGEGTVTLSSSNAPDDRLRVTREEWVAFVAAIKAGEFDNV